MTQQGLLQREGKGRGARYRRESAPGSRFRYPREGLAEDRVWGEVSRGVPFLERLADNALSILHYALSEIVNNAIDHSGGTFVDVAFMDPGDPVVFEVIDDGVGAFEHVRARLGLPDLMAAVQEVSKGKVTTSPGTHTGEGIFFVSKIADFFELESSGLCWRVDNARADTSVAGTDARPGTRVRIEVAPATTRTLAALFSEYAEGFEFSKTRIVVKLFAIGVRFISRSEAKRLLHGLERFREVVLDFRGVHEVGQGFADEVFRVWASAHPGVRIAAVEMAPTVEFMVKRAQAAR
jgi:anti-sigma regulatory factor (Ser/Thr protein kinase)